MLKRKLLTIYTLALFLLAGCSDLQMNNKSYDLNEFSKGKKSIVLVQSTYLFNTTLRGLVKKKAKSVWKKENSRQSFTVNSLCFIPFTDGVSDQPDYEIHLVDPGKYYLEPYSMLNMNGGYSVTFDPIVFFEVKAGDVAYVGDLYINADCLTYGNCSALSPKIGVNCGQLSLENSFEMARLFLKRNHPELADRLTLNLVNGVCLPACK